MTGAGILMDNLISVDGTDQYQLIEETQLLDLGGKTYPYIKVTGCPIVCTKGSR